MRSSEQADEPGAGVVRTRRYGHVLEIMIDRPERRNALNAAVSAGIGQALDAAEADGEVRAVVLTGAGTRAFCAGGDMQADASGTPFSMNEADPRNHVAGLFRRMEACRLPIIARVNGHALAGGFGLVCACDLVVARDDALLGVSEVKIGLFPMMILPFLLRTVPARTMMEMCLTGEPITAADAARERIINTPCPPTSSMPSWIGCWGGSSTNHPPASAGQTGARPGARNDHRQCHRICAVHAGQSGAHR